MKNKIKNKQEEIRNLYAFFSHPDVIHSDHTFNVTLRVIESCKNFNVDIRIYIIASIWHDTFKIYYKFQKHLKKEPVDYKDHGIPSAIIFFICFAYYKENGGSDFSWLDGFKIMNIISNHHSTLKPMFINSDNDNVVIFNRKDEIYNSIHDYETSIKYIRKDFESIFNSDGINYINEFFELSFGYKAPIDDLLIFIKKCIFAREKTEKFGGEALYNKIFKDKYIKLANNEWIQNPSKHSLHMRMGFSLLCESDRYIARQQAISPNNIKIYQEKNIKKHNRIFEKNIKKQYLLYSIKNLFIFKSKSRKLNELKNSAKKIAVEQINKHLTDTNNRVFQLVLNTGFGKTHLSALISSIIQKRHGYIFRTILAIPFRTLIEQTYKIYQNLIGDTNIIQYMSASVNYNQLDEDLSKLDESDIDYSIKRNDIIGQEISYNTFDMPCVATTFVQFFELFDSRHGSDLLKLKNLSNSIFVIDEFQSLDKKEYLYYTAQLELFCEMFNSYAILMTATMPVLDNIDKNIIPLDPDMENKNLHKLNKIGCYNKSDLHPIINFNEIFKNYYKPINLIPEKNIEYFFTNSKVNRYKVTYLNKVNDIYDLTNVIKDKIKVKKIKSILVVNNTIKCCNRLNELLLDNIPEFEIFKITSEMLADDKNEIIKKFKYNIRHKIPTILCTTQVVECGMDISVDSVFSDNCPIPNLIQRYGRGNRYFFTDIIDVYIYKLKDIDNLKFPNSYYFQYIYPDAISKFNLTNINNIEEKDLFYIQRKSFDDTFKNVEHGIFKGEGKHIKVSAYNNLFFNIFAGLLKYHKIIPDRDSDAGKVLMYVKSDPKSEKDWDEFVYLFKNCKNDNLSYEEKINLDKELIIKHKKILRYCINVKNDVAFETYTIENKEYDAILLIKKLKIGNKATHKYVPLKGLIKL